MSPSNGRRARLGVELLESRSMMAYGLIYSPAPGAIEAVLEGVDELFRVNQAASQIPYGQWTWNSSLQAIFFNPNYLLSAAWVTGVDPVFQLQPTYGQYLNDGTFVEPFLLGPSDPTLKNPRPEDSALTLPAGTKKLLPIHTQISIAWPLLHKSPRFSSFENGTWWFDVPVDLRDEVPEKSLTFGQKGDIATPGDWDGDGHDTLGVFRNGYWHLDTNGISGWQWNDTTIYMGYPGDIPVVGDWNGDGRDQIGVFRNGYWHLDTNGIPGWQWNDTTIYLGYPGDHPVVGDWNGDGRDEIGVVRNSIWYLDTNGIPGWQWNDTSYQFGGRGDTPVVEDWDRDGKDDAGVYRNGIWTLDSNHLTGYQPTDLQIHLDIGNGQPIVPRRDGLSLYTVAGRVSNSLFITKSNQLLPGTGTQLPPPGTVANPVTGLNPGSPPTPGGANPVTGLNPGSPPTDDVADPVTGLNPGSSPTDDVADPTTGLNGAAGTPTQSQRSRDTFGVGLSPSSLIGSSDEFLSPEQIDEFFIALFDQWIGPRQPG